MTSRLKPRLAIAFALALGLGSGSARADDIERQLHGFQPYGVGVGGHYSLPPAGGVFPGPVTFRPTASGTPDGILYGVTTNGGSCKEPPGESGCGIAFKLTPPLPGSTHWLFSRIYVFKGSSDGLYPFGRLIFDASGAAYGVTQQGGPCDYAVFPCGYGTVFRLTPPGPGGYFWSKTILHAFTGGADGAMPASDVTFDATGALVGITDGYGAPADNDPRVVYRLAPPASAGAPWKFTVLHSFPVYGTPGAAVEQPLGGVVSDSAGNLYGITDFNSFLNAQVFRLTPPTGLQAAWTYTTLYKIPIDPNNQLYSPGSRLVLDRSGTLYGSLEGGAAQANGEYAGAVFSLAPPAAGQTAWRFAIAHAFNGIDGVTPNDLAVLDRSGSVYGATNGRYEPGQANNYWGGVVFRLDPPPAGQTAWSETVLDRSPSEAGFDAVRGALIEDASGALYTTRHGTGGDDNGSIFRLTPAAGR